MGEAALPGARRGKVDAGVVQVETLSGADRGGRHDLPFFVLRSVQVCARSEEAAARRVVALRSFRLTLQWWPPDALVDRAAVGHAGDLSLPTLGRVGVQGDVVAVGGGSARWDLGSARMM